MKAWKTEKIGNPEIERIYRDDKRRETSKRIKRELQLEAENKQQAERIKELNELLEQIAKYPEWITNEAGLDVPLCISRHNKIILDIRSIAEQALREQP